LSLKIYRAGRDYARQRGIIIADSKFEFGLKSGNDASARGKLILIDDVLTPDSSRPARNCRTTSSPKPA
jgi:phosphoribosylaminoimidazole-succinocarboxamide synthase